MEGIERDLIESYLDSGFYLFPVASKSKVPLIKDMLNQASNDIEQLEKWRTEFPGCNFGLSLAKSGLWALDVDLNHHGLDKWNTIAMSLGEPQTLMQKTGSGGYHYLFKAEENMRLKGKITPGIDIKYNGFIVLAPATNKNDKPYTWPNGFDKTKINELKEEWLRELVNKDIKEIPLDLKPSDVKLSVVEEAADHLSQESLSYEDWLTVGMAFHAYNEGKEGLELWLKVTSGAGYQDGDLDRARDKWSGFSARPDGIGIASLFYIVKEYCGFIPNLTLDYDKIAFRKPFSNEFLHEKDIYKEFYDDGTGSMVCWHKQFIVDQINRRYALLDKGMVAKISFREDGTKDVTTRQVKDFKTEIAHLKQVFEVELKTETKRKYQPASDIWLTHKDRRCYERVVFEPPHLAGDNELNLWSDIPCVAKSGSVEPFLEFMFKHVCDSSQAHYDWLLQWTAHKIQHLEVKSTIVPILQGPQGTGKGLFTDGFLRKMYGGLYHKIMSSARIKDRFNRDQAYRQIIVLDEATWQGDVVEAGILKSLTGSTTQTIEEKFGASFEVRNSANYIITTNSHVSAAITKDDRRYQTFEMKKLPKGQSAKILKPYWDYIKKPESVSFVYNYLLNQVDVTEFDPYTPPALKGGDIAKIKSEGAISMYLHDLLFEKPRELFIDGEWFDKDSAYDSLLNFAKATRSHEKNITRQAFTQILKEIFPSITEQRRTFGEFKTKVMKITPEEFMRGYCKALSIEEPKAFEGLDYFLDSKELI